MNMVAKSTHTYLPRMGSIQYKIIMHLAKDASMILSSRELAEAIDAPVPQVSGAAGVLRDHYLLVATRAQGHNALYFNYMLTTRGMALARDIAKGDVILRGLNK